MRRRRSRGLLVLIVALLTFFPAEAARSESTSARAENLAKYCATSIANQPTYIWGCEGAMVNEPFHQVDDSLIEVNNQIMIANARKATAKVGDMATAVVGSILNQFQRLTGLQATLDVDVTDLRVAAGAKYGSTSVYYNVPLGSKLMCVINALPGVCSTLLSSGSRDTSYNDSVSNFVWNNTAKLKEDPGRQACKCMNGQAIWTIYTAKSQPRPEFEFTATSQKSSFTPQNGYGLKEIYTYIERSANRPELELVDADPVFVDSEGSGGSTSIGASLSGEFGVGGSFSIGRSWNRPAGWSGGGWLENEHHYGYWRDNGAPDPYAKSTAGVETWKEPAGQRALWDVGYEITAGK